MGFVAEAVVVDLDVFEDLVVDVPGRLAETAPGHAGEVGEEEPGREEADHLARVGRVWTYFFLIGGFGARSTRSLRAGSAGPRMEADVRPWAGLFGLGLIFDFDFFKPAIPLISFRHMPKTVLLPP